MANLFISYTRRDQAFVHRLHDALVALGHEVWVDFEDIPYSAKWLAEIYSGIEKADAFISILDPEYIASENCLKEVEHAVKNNKRLVPLVRRDVDPNKAPQSLAEINWIYMRDSDDFDARLKELGQTINTDLDWVKAHTRLLIRAIEWNNSKRDDSLVLRGRDLREAEEWQSHAAAGKQPTPTELQLQYILASRRSATSRQRRLLGAVTVALVVSIVLALVAVYQTNVATNAKETAIAEANARATEASVRATAEAVAIDQRNLAQSRELAVTANAQANANPELSLLLAFEAVRIAPTAESESALRSALLLAERQTLRTGTMPVGTVEFSPDGKFLLTTIHSSPARLWEVDTGKPIGVLGEESVGDVRFSPDGKLIALTDNGAVLVFDAATAKMQSRFQDPGKNTFLIDFSSDSRLVLASSTVISQSGAETDTTVGVWDPRTGKPLAGFKGDRSGKFSPDGKSVASYADATTRLWDISNASTSSTLAITPKLVAELKGHTGAILSAQFSPDGTTLVTTSDDKTARLWDAHTGKLLAELRGHSGPVAIARYSRNSQLIATAAAKPANEGTAADSTVRLWDAHTGKSMAVLQAQASWFTSVEFNASSTYIMAVSGDWKVYLWDTSGARWLGPTGLITDAWFGPDGSTIVTLGACTASDCDSTVRVWADHGTLLAFELHGHTSWINHAAFSRDGRWVATAGDDGTARIWDISANSKMREFVPLNAQGSIMQERSHFSPDGKWVVIPYSDKRARVFETQTGRQVAELAGHTGGLINAAFSPDGKRIITVSEDKTARVWDLATGKQVLAPFVHPDTVYQGVYSPDGRWIATISDITRLWDASTGSKIADLSGAKTASFSPDRQLLVTAGDPRLPLQIWDTTTGKVVSTIGKSGFTGAIFSPNGKSIATLSWDNIARVWDATTGKLMAEFVGHTTPIDALTFSPDSRRLFTGGDDGAALIWDVSTGKVASVLYGHRDSITQAAFSSDGNFIVTASDDRTARVWDANTGTRLLSLTGQPNWVHTVWFTPDNKYVLTGTYDGTRLYACEVCAPLQDIVALARTRIDRQLTCEERHVYLHEKNDCASGTPTPQK